MFDKASYCSDCERRFGLLRWRRECGCCGKAHCRSCMIAVSLPPWASSLSTARLCGTCHAKEAAPLEAGYRGALEGRRDVIAYVGRYRGDPGVDEGSRIAIQSGLHGDKDSAVRELQTMAAFHERELIEELAFQEQTVEETAGRPGEGPLPFGERTSSSWRAVGFGARLHPPKLSS